MIRNCRNGTDSWIPGNSRRKSGGKGFWTFHSIDEVNRGRFFVRQFGGLGEYPQPVAGPDFRGGG